VSATPSRRIFNHAEIQSAAAAVRDRTAQLDESKPVARIGMVLGSGLGRVADVVLEDSDGIAIEYAGIPHFPTSSVEGHKGRLVYGKVDGEPVLLMQGRVHRYEGYAPADVAFPAKVLVACGVEKLVLTNAAGGIADGMKPGDLMLINDHLNLTGDNPLIGANDDRLGPRFPDMSATYTPALQEIAREVAKAQGVSLLEGIYAGLNGPSYETPAEIHMLRTLGADAVGMSTVYEAIAAAHAGAQVLGVSCITNLAAGMSDEKLSHDDVKETAAKVEKVFSDLVLALLPRLAGA
jgi:purine-nucleoside phosphorylase